MKHALRFCIVLIHGLLLAGCSTSFFAAPTLTATATYTPTGTPTPTRTHTPTPTETATSTPEPGLPMGERKNVLLGGFTLRIPKGYDFQIDERQAFVAEADGTLVISFVGVDAIAPADEIVDRFLDELAGGGDGRFEKSPSEPVLVGGRIGTAYNLSGSLFGSPVKGKTFIVPIPPNRFLYALGFSNISRNQDQWENHGAEVFEAIVNSIEIVETLSAGTCPISADETYGYTKENAIRVGDGGSFLDGPARERAFLDNLRGPNGEPISYERAGSLNFEDTILDAYVIDGLPSPATLYLDMYEFEELSAPVGFTCVGAFNLEP